MERTFSAKCSKCRESAVALAAIYYSVQIDNDGRKYEVNIPDLVVPRCAKCGNFVLHEAANCRITAEFRKVAGLLTPEEIQHHRKRLGLSQEELAERLGITVLMLSRWESGEFIQPRSLDRFLRAFFTVPELRKSLAEKRTLELSTVG